MTTVVDQKAYLQKYLGGPSGEKKKKKKKVVKGKGFKIIDDDLDLSKLRPLDGDELDVFDEGEDAPQVAGIIDERPEHVKKQEQFGSSSKWKIVNHDDGFNSKLQIEEIVRDVKETEKENEIIFGKMYSDSEDEKKKDSDASPPRKTSKNKKHNSDSDFSPPRKNNTRKDSPKKNYDSDLSPPRKHENKRTDKVKRPSRWDNDPKPKRSESSDISPPRKTQRNESPNRNRNRYEKQNTYDKRSRKDQDLSPRRKRSPERQKPSKDRKYPDSKHDRRRKLSNSDSDLSPPRKHKREISESPYKSKRKDDSFPKKDKRYNEKINQKRIRNDSDSDMSPPRKVTKGNKRKDSDSDLSPPRKGKRHEDSPPPTHKKMDKTLEGKKAGLQDARQLRQENEDFRRKEEEVYKRMTDDVSGRNAQVVSRKGKRDTSEDRKRQQEKAERQKEMDEKYKRWSKGLKQIEAQEERLQDFIHEASKPLARHRDDMDSESRLKQIARDGDPMLKYIQERKRERGELPLERPQYKGNFPPNRFNLRPGYRWDGVDRSNGYEKKYFEQQSKRKAQEEEAYKWSTEDL